MGKTQDTFRHFGGAYEKRAELFRSFVENISQFVESIKIPSLSIEDKSSTECRLRFLGKTYAFCYEYTIENGSGQSYFASYHVRTMNEDTYNLKTKLRFDGRGNVQAQQSTDWPWNIDNDTEDIFFNLLSDAL